MHIDFLAAVFKKSKFHKNLQTREWKFVGEVVDRKVGLKLSYSVFWLIWYGIMAYHNEVLWKGDK